MTRLPLLFVLAALVFPATAAARTCPKTSDYELTKVRGGVTCKRAEKVLARYFADNEAPGNWTCKQKFFEGGVTTKCRNGEKRIKHFSAD
jgi:AAA+ superfamily predicted ATPase